MGTVVYQILATTTKSRSRKKWHELSCSPAMDICQYGNRIEAKVRSTCCLNSKGLSFHTAERDNMQTTLAPLLSFPWPTHHNVILFARNLFQSYSSLISTHKGRGCIYILLAGQKILEAYVLHAYVWYTMVVHVHVMNDIEIGRTHS